jgi:hypothetical protein
MFFKKNFALLNFSYHTSQSVKYTGTTMVIDSKKFLEINCDFFKKTEKKVLGKVVKTTEEPLFSGHFFLIIPEKYKDQICFPIIKYDDAERMTMNLSPGCYFDSNNFIWRVHDDDLFETEKKSEKK